MHHRPNGCHRGVWERERKKEGGREPARCQLSCFPVLAMPSHTHAALSPPPRPSARRRRRALTFVPPLEPVVLAQMMLRAQPAPSLGLHDLLAPPSVLRRAQLLGQVLLGHRHPADHSLRRSMHGQLLTIRRGSGGRGGGLGRPRRRRRRAERRRRRPRLTDGRGRVRRVRSAVVLADEPRRVRHDCRGHRGSDVF